jgi:hypothetical protein
MTKHFIAKFRQTGLNNFETIKKIGLFSNVCQLQRGVIGNKNCV